MNRFQENTVSAVNQNSSNVYICGEGGFRVLFVGNSITKHRPKPEMGWTNDCGMAASSPENDYVHLLMKKIREEYKEDASYCIATAADFEREFFKDGLKANIENRYSLAKEYNPDIMIMFFGANVPKEYDETASPKVKFGDAYEKLRNYLKGDNTLVFHSQGFYIRPILDAEKEAVAKKYGDTFINIEDIRNRADTHGKFNHPGDIGMKEIAEAFWKAIKPKLNGGQSI